MPLRVALHRGLQILEGVLIDQATLPGRSEELLGPPAHPTGGVLSEPLLHPQVNGESLRIHGRDRAE
ncbi:MAG: hypothetical protein RLN76_08805 [Phycisphaeraceae bacterium]